MPFPHVDQDFETFFEPTRIWLFGKPFSSLTYNPDSMKREFSKYNASATKGADLPMPPRRIERTLRRKTGDKDPIFARIYSFSYEGHYYKLPRPLLFLVYSQGEYMGERKEQPKKSEIGEPQNSDRTDEDRSHSPQNSDPITGRVSFNTKFAGVEARDWHFSEDIRVWQVDKKDLAVCLDIETGAYEQILLDSMVAFQEEMESRGSIPGRGSATSGGSATSRGAIGFRGLIGPHQNR